jgi:hypothetical protein
MATASSSRTATTPGSCNWKAQPTSLPAVRKGQHDAPERETGKDHPGGIGHGSTWALWLLLRASVSALRLRIGKTQGMMLSTSPPASAPRTASVISRHENATGWPVPEAAVGTVGRSRTGVGDEADPAAVCRATRTPESIVGRSRRRFAPGKVDDEGVTVAAEHLGRA